MIPHHIRLVELTQHCKTQEGTFLTVQEAQHYLQKKCTMYPPKSQVLNTFERAAEIEGYYFVRECLVYETPVIHQARLQREKLERQEQLLKLLKQEQDAQAPMWEELQASEERANTLKAELLALQAA